MPESDIERVDVTNELRVFDRELWSPDHTISIDAKKNMTLMDKLGEVAAATVGYIPQEVLDQSFQFASDALKKFNEYAQGKTAEHARGHAFLIPVTLGEDEIVPGETFQSEIATALPMLQYVDRVTEHRTLLSLPPTEVGVYRQQDPRIREGSALYTPITMEIQNQNGRKALKIARDIVSKTVDFAHNYYGVDIIGLGGVIPAFTRYGNKIDTSGVETTTGHGGTVWLINKTIEEVEKEVGMGQSDVLSIVGAGSIGYAAATDLLSKRKDLKVYIYDTNFAVADRTAKVLQHEFGEQRVVFCETLKEAIEASRITVSAITGKLAESDEYKDIDFSGRFIVDDSHPNSASRIDIESKGGFVIGVFGDAHGVIDREPIREDMPAVRYCGGKVAGQHDVWGCEAEVNALAMTRGFKPITGPVSRLDVLAVGRQLEQLGVTAARLQSYGRLVDTPKAA